jgi:hypothetical protein
LQYKGREIEIAASLWKWGPRDSTDKANKKRQHIQSLSKWVILD